MHTNTTPIEASAGYGDGRASVFVMLDTDTASMNGSLMQSAPLTPDEARALAAELLRAADAAMAIDSARGMA